MFQPTCIFLVVILAWSANGQGSKCGIIGNPANETEAPWLVSVLKKDRHACAGVIVSMKYIITAADCLGKAKTSELKVRAGSVDQKRGTVQGVCKLTVHQQSKTKDYANNLALLRLCEPLVESATIKDIDLLDKRPADGETVTVYGWGTAGFWTKIRKPCLAKDRLIVRKVSLEVYSVKRCIADRKAWYKPLGRVVSEVNICTKKPEKFCSYDMGSPLISGKSLVGIMSKADCSNQPEVYTSLENHKDWLATNTKE